ncbi:MAG: periplasmic heavy metal sensor [Candidatus Binataceae bacterium]
MRLKTLLLSLLLAAAIPAAAFAQPHGHGPGRGMPMPMMMLLRHVNLTADQRTQVHQMMEANFTQAQPLMTQLHSIHDQIADKLLSPGNVTVADLAPLQQQESQIRQQLDHQMLATALKVRGVLTPAQLAQAADLHGKLKSLRAQFQTLMGDEPPATDSAPE